MSLLIAANLVDRIYMCADTRISTVKEKDGDYYYEKLHDNQLKISHIDNTNITVGCVGSPALGAFILKKIKAAKPEITYTGDLYEYISCNVDEIKIWIQEYLCIPPQTKYRYANCVLLFAGQDGRRKRKVNGKKLVEFAGVYQDESQRKIDSLFEGKAVEKLTQAELGRLMYESQNSQMALKPVLYDAMTKMKGVSEYMEIHAPDQHLFSLEIDSCEDEIVQLNSYEWGDTPVYGAGYDSSILIPTFFGHLDLNKDCGDTRKDIIPFVATIKDHFGDTIGGSITNMVLHEAKIYTITQRLVRMDKPGGKEELLYHTENEGGKLYHNIPEGRFELTPFTELTKDSSARLDLAL